MDKREEDLVQQISISCISIIRYISDHLNQLVFPIRHHIMNVKDVLLLLVPLIDLKPWIRINEKGNEEIYEGNKWVESNKNTVKLNKIEAQVYQ